MTRPAPADPCHAAGETRIESLALDGGGRIEPARVAWRRYGPEPAQARAVVLLLHGISGSQQALAPVSGEVHPDAGWAYGWLGSGAALDTRHTCVLAPNALGSCFGSSAPDAESPASFPDFTITDSVRLQGLWLRALGVARLDAVVGYSYGGYQAFQWALDPPVPLGRALALASGPRGGGSWSDVIALRRLAAARRAGDALAQEQWVAARRDALMRYGRGLWLADAGAPEPGQALDAEARAWAARFSPWSMAALRAAACRHDVRHALASLRAPLYWLRCASDLLFPPGDETALPPCVHPMTVAGRYGHASPALEGPLWDACLRRALA